MFTKPKRIVVFIIIVAFLSATLIIPTNAYADDVSKYESLNNMSIALSIGVLLITLILVLGSGNKKADTEESLLNNQNVYPDGEIYIRPYIGLNVEKSKGNSKNEALITGLSFNF